MKKYESLHERLRGPIVEALKKELKVTNVHALPRITKVTVNVGINRSKMESKEMQEYIGQCLGKMTGQKAVYTRSRKAISNFKIRQGLIVGAVVTLHGRKMEEFLDRFLSYVLPRIRDFRGVTSKLDGHGNYAIGLRDHSIFPEVPPPDAGRIFGVQIQFTTNAKDDDSGRALLKAMGVPFRPSRTGKSASSHSS